MRSFRCMKRLLDRNGLWESKVLLQEDALSTMVAIRHTRLWSLRRSVLGIGIKTGSIVHLKVL